QGRTLANRWAIHPMEGWDGSDDGLPSKDTLRRWRNFGRSGAALIWGGEAFAVCPEGRANPHQLHQGSHNQTGDGLKQLMAELRAGQAEAELDPQESFVGLQLTHSGRWSRPTADGPSPRIAYRHPVLDARVGIEDERAVFSDEELAALPGMYASAALLAEEAGFDFVDVKCCHGYLLHEVLSGHARPGPYGGSFENRTRLFRECVAAVRATAPSLEIGVRVSITDVFPYTAGPDGKGAPVGMEAHTPYEHGFGINPQNPLEPEYSEPFQFLALLEEMDIGWVNLSIGSPYYCPHVQRPAAFPPSDGYQPHVDPLEGVAKHLLTARACKEAFPNLAFVGSGYTYLQDYLPHVAQHEVGSGHVDFVGLGRMVLSYPELPLDTLSGKGMQRKRICRTFSDCTTGPRNGLRSGCYPLDPEYRTRPEAKVVRDLRPSKK
ncbi:MAG: NADH:flavin oxidoreductase, partial [Planctomycetes bacterium]|nr:NADH:flavin oxidoreductase [Planctomycetota bacterium]